METKIEDLDALHNSLTCKISGCVALCYHRVPSLDEWVQRQPGVKRFADDVAGAGGVRLDVFQFAEANADGPGFFVCCQRFAWQGGLGPLELADRTPESAGPFLELFDVIEQVVSDLHPFAYLLECLEMGGVEFQV